MDRVQVVKRESAALGGDAADEAPWDAPIEPQEDAVEAAGVYLQDPSNRDESTLVARSGDDMTFKDGNNTSPLTLTELAASAGGGITEGQHEVLDTLVHALAEDLYLEVTRTAGKVSNVTVYTDSGKTTKIRELANIVRTGGRIDSYDLIQYDGVGSVKQTMAYAITRTAGRVSSITATES